jgi:cold shock CspA family protein/ribosome-associated translation inhibitor RaiA
LQLLLRRTGGYWLALKLHLIQGVRRIHDETGEVMVIKIPLQITFKSMEPSEAIEAHVREAAVKLDSFYGEIMGCRVLVEAPHQHHRKGKQYHVRIDLTVPGGELVIKRAPRLIRPLRQVPDDVAQGESREPSKYAAHDDIQLAIRDAFDAARRKLQDYARRRRGVLKLHEGSPHARVSKLFPDEGFGFLETADGREIYFHENSVLDAGFEGLQIGAEVHFAEEMGEKGPQATTVMPVTHHSR